MTSKSGDALDRLISDLQAYVAALETAGQDAHVVVPAMERVRAAAGEFVDASHREGGWGNPFRFANSTDEQPSARSPGARGAIVVRAEYRVEVEDAYAAAKLAAHRTAVTGQGHCDYDDLSWPIEAVRALFVADGWNLGIYDRNVVRFLGAESEVLYAAHD